MQRVCNLVIDSILRELWLTYLKTELRNKFLSCFLLFIYFIYQTAVELKMCSNYLFQNPSSMLQTVQLYAKTVLNQSVTFSNLQLF
jgi:hypothetical protein